MPGSRATAYGKMFEAEKFCGLQFFTQLWMFPQIAALSISNISLQACYSKSFWRISIFHSKCDSFPLKRFALYGILFQL